LLLCARRQAKQQVGIKPGFEGSPDYGGSHTVTLFKQLVHGLAVSWFYPTRDSKYCIVSCQIKFSLDQYLLTIAWLTFIINQSVVNIYHTGT
jgi:hypothetical protein